MRRFSTIIVIAFLLTPARGHATSAPMTPSLPVPQSHGLLLWGGDGHRVACGVAWQRLNPQAMALVTRLLGANDEKSFVDACLWADDVRPQRPETYNYHFINIPAGKSALDMVRDCGDAQKRCAPWAIAHFARILADAKAPDAQRLDALRFVIHFVGDLHQPLHAGRPEDRGGNDVKVNFFGNAGSTERPLNLHSVWDSQILRRANQQWPEMSRRLVDQINADEAKQWETLDVVGWANESYRLCEDFIYGRLASDRKIGNMYYYPALGYTEAQLQKAGVRMAHLLNSVAGGTAPAAI